MADNLYQIMEGLQVSREEILEAETFTTKYLKANFPDLDLREGVALYDLVIRPGSMFIALANKGIKFYFDNNNPSVATDDTPEEMVDKFMSNFFLSRNTGSSSIVRARLYFIDKNRDIYISATSTFSTDNETVFRPIADARIRSGEVTDDVPGDFTYDPNREEYYYDLDLISSSQDEAANIESGEFIYFSNIDPYYLGSSILYLSQRAVPRESNTQFIDRSSTAISTRNLINDPSIDSLIRSSFNYVTNLVPVGHGDAEMMRDYIVVAHPTEAGELQELHIGGKVDVYIDAPTAPQEPPEVIQLEIPVDGIIDIEAYPGSASNASYIIYDIRRATEDEASIAGINTSSDISPLAVVTIQIGEGTGDDFRQVGTLGPDMRMVDVGFSSRQTTRVIVTDPNVSEGGFTITLRYWRFTGVVSVQQFLDNKVNKVMCADYLARSLNNYAVDINVTRVGGVALSERQLEAIQTTLKTFFSKMKAGETLIVSNIVKTIVADSGISDIDVNIGVSYTYFNKDFNGDSGVITSFKNCDRTDIFVLRHVTSSVS